MQIHLNNVRIWSAFCYFKVKNGIRNFRPTNLMKNKKNAYPLSCDLKIDISNYIRFVSSTFIKRSRAMKLFES